MDWTSAMKEERAALKRIVALLFALAVLAESSSRRSGLVRGFVIWILRRAEAVAWDFVIGAAEAPRASTLVVPAGDSPAEALRLAQSFRHLAGELERQARLAFAQGCAENGGLARFSACRLLDTRDVGNALRRLVLENIACRAACAGRPPDTS
jgi:hypothetical protein